MSVYFFGCCFAFFFFFNMHTHTHSYTEMYILFLFHDILSYSLSFVQNNNEWKCKIKSCKAYICMAEKKENVLETQRKIESKQMNEIERKSQTAKKNSTHTYTHTHKVHENLIRLFLAQFYWKQWRWREKKAKSVSVWAKRMRKCKPTHTHTQCDERKRDRVSVEKET